MCLKVSIQHISKTRTIVSAHKVKTSDTSFCNYFVSEVSPGDPYMAEESNESDDIEWELK